MTNSRTTFEGGCHCGAVRFRAALANDSVAHECNCSICNQCGFLHLIVPAEHFTLTQGAEDLTHYRFNSGVAKHSFCRVCGIKPFYVPRSNPNGFSVNARCLDVGNPFPVEPFDGQNWEQNAHTLHGLA